MTPTKFDELLEEFSSSHPIFANERTPIQVQFMVAFHRLGCFGNAASVGLIADYFAVSG